MRTSDRHDLLRRRPFGICRQAKWGMTSEAKSSRVSPSFRSPLISRSMPAPRYCRIIDAALKAGAQYLVRVGGSRPLAKADSESVVGRGHAAIEERLKASGIKWVILRPGPFMQNVLDQAASI